MPEMTHAGKYHRYAMLVSSSDDFVIAHGAARLNHCFDPDFCGVVYAIAERKESIRSHH